MYLENQGKKIKYDLSPTEPGKLDAEAFLAISDYLKKRKIRFSQYLPAPFGKIGPLARGLRKTLGINKFLENSSPHGSIPESLIDGQLLDGFWQRNQYTDFLADFLTVHLEQDQVVGSHEKLVVHVRRGDFVSLGLNLDIDFYKRAIFEIFSMHKNLTSITLVSDDRYFCEQNFADFSNLEIFEGKDSKEDFLFLAKAKYLLISKSTFSWWAARIGKKNVFYPSPWDPTKRTADQDIVPLNWIPMFHPEISEPK